MTLDEAIKLYESNAEYERTHGSLQGCLNFRQLAEWLRDYKRLKEQGGDTISRQVVLEVLKDKWNAFSDANDAMQESIDTIEALPPVNSQKTGHWIDDRCSECGKGIEDLIDSREWYRNEQPNFCPFCGVKLINSQESEGKV